MSVTLTQFQTKVNDLVTQLTNDGIDPSTVKVVAKTSADSVYHDIGFGVQSIQSVPAAGTSVHVRVFSGGSETCVEIV
jgi:long-subunit acyl-CoA synthetase (AMP-forming)